MAGSRYCACCIALAAGLWCSTAGAGDFLSDGSYVFDAKVVARESFEDGAPEPLEGEEPIALAESDSALEGRFVATVPSFSFGGFLVDVLPDKRAYRASVWMRGNDASARLTIVHDGGMTSDDFAVLYPTGRMTSDGWIELAQDGIRIDGARSAVVFGVFNPHQALIEYDAFELAVEGAVDQVTSVCAGASDPVSCGPDQVCVYGECKNVANWVPPIPASRDDVKRYLENRLRFLFGPYANRTLDLPAALDAMKRMDTAADPWTYWNGFMLAVRRLHDWHTRISGVGFSLDSARGLNLCFIEGDADLSHHIAPSDPSYLDIIVSHVGEGDVLGMKAGDRLVAVDGKHPTQWARELIGFYWDMPVVGNRVSYPDHAGHMRTMIARFAHDIDIVRCDPSTLSCGPVEHVVIGELPALPDDVDIVACDHRPLRHLPDAPANHAGGGSDVFHGLLLESDPSEAIYGVEWESLSTNFNGTSGVGPNLKAAINQLREEAAGAILDHRTGNGGTLGGCDIVWDWAVAAHPISYMKPRPTAQAEQPTQAEGVSIYQAGLGLGAVDYAGSTTPTTIPVALLITRSGSASDWLPLGLKNTTPNIRIFGPHESEGAFSTRYELGYGLGLGYVLASADTFVPTGESLNGYGVVPDEIVVPKQSDLLAGVDTVFEAALAWVRSQLP